ncbi:hypothetical protein BDR07DRAFT_1294809, partial [Suillus spraguei]
FGVPNGLCSSITEFKHIKAVKERWCQSSGFETLSQMLLTNQHLNKLAASQVDFDDHRGCYEGHVCHTSWTNLGNANAEPDAVAVARPMVLAHVDLAKTAELIADQIGQPNFTTLIQHFLHDQCHSDSDSDTDSSSSDLSQSALPEIYEKITLYTSAMATFFAPSDISGIGSMHYECICAVNTWRNAPGHNDCIFISTDSSADGMHGFDIA